MLLQTGDTKTTGECEHYPLTQSERIKMGFKSGMIFWVLAPCFLPIPLLHFILVPLMLALGTFRAWDYWTSAGVLKNGKTKCPRCEEKLAFDVLPEKWPLKVLCPNCAYQVRLYPVNIIAVKH